MLKFSMLFFWLLVSLSSEILSQNVCKVSIKREVWGETFDPINKKNVTVHLYTLDNCKSTRVQIISYGASITSIFTPDNKGKLEDIVLGFDDIKGYQHPQNAYLGATLGRVANRIGGGRFNISNTQYDLAKNIGNNTIHGGPFSFGKVFWDDCSENITSLTLCHESPDGEGGFPGTVQASVKYTLNTENELRIQFTARTDKATPINMANHAYFNLAGHKAGSPELYEHVVQIKADKYTPMNCDSLPTGDIKNVQGTYYDLRNWTTLGLAMALNVPSGFDHNFVLSCRENDTTSKTPCLAARIFHPDTKRVLYVFTNQPGMQFYTSNSLNVTGKENTYYGKHSAFCVETQHFPDSVNHPNFPSIIVQPTEVYSYETIYKFEIGKF